MPPDSSLRLALVLAVGVAAGCGDELPLEERIASTRPLAIQIEVLEPTRPAQDPSRAEGMPLDTIRVRPFVVGTQAPLTAEEIETQLEPVWLACNMQPRTGLFGCLSARFPIALADIADCEPTDLAALDPAAMQFPQTPNPCRVVDGTPGQPEMQIPLDLGFLLGGDLEITMVGHQPGEGSTEACARAVLGAADSIPGDCILATMRAPVGPDGALTTLATMFGLDQNFDLGPVPDPIPDPDQNPQIATFTVAVLDQDDNVKRTVEVARGDVLQAQLGDRIEIITEAAQGGQQTYVITKDSTDFESKTEEYSGAWFRTWGDLLSDSSDDPRSMNTWTMIKGQQDQDELPPDGRATLYYVLRDDRQGVDWWWFSVDVTP